jgi:hypothetical protein
VREMWEEKEVCEGEKGRRRNVLSVGIRGGAWEGIRIRTGVFLSRY